MPNKTTSLETSKLLKEAGFRQDNISKYHVHRIDSRGRNEWTTEDLYTFPRDKVKEFIAAPTTDELLEELPQSVFKENDNRILVIENRFDNNHNSKYWMVSCRSYHDDITWGCQTDKSLPEALAQMYLFLANKGFINAKRNI